MRKPWDDELTRRTALKLGLSTAVAAPHGDDVAGDVVRAALAEEGVELIAQRSARRTPTTVVLPFGGDRAMVTVDPGVRASAADVAVRQARAVAASLDQLHVVPAGAFAYVTCGDDDARAFVGRPPAALRGVRTLFLNRGEALGLTGGSTPEDAARTLAEFAQTVVVTLAADGAIACSGDEIVSAPAKQVEPVDSTGAGDLLAAAYIWADLRGAEPADRLRWAVLYASLAVTRPSGLGGAVKEAELIEAGAEQGLATPPAAGSISSSRR